MSYVRTTDEILDGGTRAVTEEELDALIAWAGAPDELLAIEPADVLGLPDAMRCALALVLELAGEGGALIRPLEAIAHRLGWSSPDEHEALRWVARERVRHWLGPALRALCDRGFLRLLDAGALLVTWRPA